MTRTLPLEAAAAKLNAGTHVGKVGVIFVGVQVQLAQQVIGK